jgi:hypothetical protein
VLACLDLLPDVTSARGANGVGASRDTRVSHHVVRRRVGDVDAHHVAGARYGRAFGDREVHKPVSRLTTAQSGALSVLAPADLLATARENEELNRATDERLVLGE